MERELCEYCVGIRGGHNSKATIAKKIDEVMSSSLPEHLRRMHAIDVLLLKLIYRKESLILDGKKEDSESLAEIIEEFKDYPWMIADSMGLTVKELSTGISRMVLLVTHSCQLRCSYCSVGKYSAEMDTYTMKKAINLLFTTSSKEVQLQFFGGEPLLRFDFVKEAVEYCDRCSRDQKKKVQFILTTNGIALTSDIIKFFKAHDFIIEFSMDGKEETQTKYRSSGKKYYHTLLQNLNLLKESGVRYQVISVVMPENVKDAFENFKYIYDKGLKNLQLNYALGHFWGEEDATELEHQMSKVIEYASDSQFINELKDRREPVVLNAEITVDCNGDIFLETGICLEEDFSKLKNDFLVGTLDNVDDLDLIFATRSRNLMKLVDVYSKGNERFRRIILNNIDMGVRMRGFFRG